MFNGIEYGLDTEHNNIFEICYFNYSTRMITTTKTDYIVKKTFLKHISYSKVSKNDI